MKAILPISCCAAMVLVGCGDSGSGSGQQTNSTSSGNPLNAPAEYGQGLVNAKQKAVKTADTASLTRAIQMFQVSEGRFPKDLKELVSLDYITKIPDAPYGQKIVYNAANGQVSVVPE